MASRLDAPAYGDGGFGVEATDTSDPANIAFNENRTATLDKKVLKFGGRARGWLPDSNLTYLVVQGDSGAGMTLTRNGAPVDATLTMARRGASVSP